MGVIDFFTKKEEKTEPVVTNESEQTVNTDATEGETAPKEHKAKAAAKKKGAKSAKKASTNRAPRKRAASATNPVENATAGETCPLELTGKHRDKFLASISHPNQRALAEMLLDGEVDADAEEKYGKYRIMEMRSKIEWARKGQEKYCKSCGKA